MTSQLARLPVKYSGSQTTKTLYDLDGTVYQWSAGGTTWVPRKMAERIIQYPGGEFQIDAEEQSDVGNVVNFPGHRAVGVIDFNGAGEAAMKVTIDGVDYQEADTADAPNGVWTNGASAADSATSLAAAINGDTRATAPAVSAVVSDDGDSVIVVADEPGTDGNLAVTTDSASNCTVENLHGGRDAFNREMASVAHTVTAQEVLADEVNVPVPFVPSNFHATVRDTNGAWKATEPTFEATIESSPDRVRLNFAGATDLVAGDVVHITIFE